MSLFTAAPVPLDRAGPQDRVAGALAAERPPTAAVEDLLTAAVGEL